MLIFRDEYLYLAHLYSSVLVPIVFSQEAQGISESM